MIQWLEFSGLESAKLRRHRLGEERMISVDSLVRCDAVRLSKPDATAASAAIAAANGAKSRGRPKTVFILPAGECPRIATHTEIKEL